MHFKRYILASVIFIVLVIAYTHMYVDEVYTMDIFGYTQTFPIAVWVVIPALLLLLGTLLHFGFYTVLTSLKRVRLEKDLDKSKTLVKHALLGKRRDEAIKDERLNLISALLTHGTVSVDKGFAFDDDELNEVLSIMNRIKSGEYVDLSRYKLAANNTLYMQNQCNRLDVEPAYAEKIIGNCQEPNSMCMKAYEAYAKIADKRRLDRITLPKNKRVVLNMIARYHAENNPLDISRDDIVALCKEVEFDEKDFIKVAQTLQENIQPDELLEVCYHLQMELEGAASAYLYANLELEKNNVAKEYLEQFDEDELRPFRYYMKLKEIGQKVVLSDFL